MSPSYGATDSVTALSVVGAAKTDTGTSPFSSARITLFRRGSTGLRSIREWLSRRQISTIRVARDEDDLQPGGRVRQPAATAPSWVRIDEAPRARETAHPASRN